MEKPSNKKLFSAAWYGNLDNFCECVAAGADIHTENWGVLRIAASGGHLCMVRYLVEQGAILVLTTGLRCAKRLVMVICKQQCT